MRGFVRTLINELFRLYAKQRSIFDVHARTKINWISMRHTSGGRLKVGRDSIINCRIEFDHPAGSINIGDRCYVGASHLVCHSSINIGNDVIISWGVTIVDHDSHSLRWSERRDDVSSWARGEKEWTNVTIKPVAIRDKVWIGFGASILKGVTLGEGCVIAANSVVTKDVPAYTVVAGNPARVVRQMDPDDARHD